MTPTETYAASVVKILAGHFPDLTDPVVAAVALTAIDRQVCNPSEAFEFIVDDPGSARWRLKARGDDRSRVRLAYCPVSPPGSTAGDVLEHVVNHALRALET
jgi:hypothetical protein